MAGELIAGLGIVKSMLDMANALKDINDAVIRNGAVIELQEKILAARQQQTALLERLSGTLHMDARFQAPVSKPITSINIGRMCKNPLRRPLSK